MQCKGCITNLVHWDLHLLYVYPHAYHKLPSADKVNTLTLTDLRDLIKSLNVKRAVLTGGDPTIDPEFPSVVRLFNEMGIGTVLFTNGDLLDEDLIRKLEKAGLNEVYVSIKAYTDSVHKQYTGHSNKRILENFKLLTKSRIKLGAGTILIPDLVDVDEIERLAKFIGEIDCNIPFRIAAYMQIPGSPWRNPTNDEMVRAANVAGKYLKNVHHSHSGMQTKGEFRVLYPNFDLDS